MTSARSPLLVVGIGADGWPGLDAARRAAVESADVLLGGERHLAMVPVDVPAERVPWPSPLRDGLPGLVAGLEGRRVVALASGDPLVSGVGTTLVGLLGADAVEVLPGVSSVALARARMRWSAESSDVVTVVGRDVHRLVTAFAPGARLLVLCSDASTPAAVAALLASHGYGTSTLTALTDLGAETESRTEGVATTWTDDVGALTVLAVEVRDAGARALPLVPGLPDDAFEHDGQVTKRDVRASALARLAPTPGALLWDVGAGAGSVSVEWARTHPRCRAVAVERDAERAERIVRNTRTLGVPEVQVVTGAAPDALADLDTPDAVFVGGGATVRGVLDACWGALRPGGRLVVHGVTLETEQLLVAWHTEHGGELVRLLVETAAPLGSFTSWTPARAVTQWSVVKEGRA
ncbi:bifunctional cobalt-precorrin-7 (C(5))-methyltransferase/cobalt-precorrin-6B (C(15))-methyltransferase [Cytobacillus oceanisediminis]